MFAARHSQPSSRNQGDCTNFRRRGCTVGNKFDGHWVADNRKYVAEFCGDIRILPFPTPDFAIEQRSKNKADANAASQTISSFTRPSSGPKTIPADARGHRSPIATLRGVVGDSRFQVHAIFGRRNLIAQTAGREINCAGR
jgi:hypothetical protein